MTVDDQPRPRRKLHAGWAIARADGDGGSAQAIWHALQAGGSNPAPPLLAPALRELGLWSPEQSTRDLDAESWTWRLRFDTPTDADAATVLGLDGLATCCEVVLNGQTLLHSDNMFIAHRLRVGHLLKPADNELLLKVSPLAPRLAQRRPRPRWRVPMLRQQQLRWWRTTLLGRTPGWSAPAPPVGPWRAIWLGGDDAWCTERLRLRPWVDGHTGWLDAAWDDAPPGPVLLELTRGGLRWQVPLQRDEAGCARGRLRVDEVALWWPHTHGEPALYEAALLCGPPDRQQRFPLAPLGFRTVAWACDGGDFALSVNGVPVFARGACWTPLDALRLHADDAAYAPALAQVRAAGLNMLRVCGPMVYEADAFHRACDAAGVLVWQDFMLANMDYPADDPAFASSLEREVRQQLRRWQASPSLALLCGNSEVEQQAAMMGTDRSLWQPPLFHHQLPTWCAQEQPDTTYWPSSAHGGGWPFVPDAGTSSYYGVGAYQRPLEDARASGLRFASECLAFAQVPENAALDRLPQGRSLRTHHPLWKQHSPRDLGAGWDFEDVRDHYLRLICGLDPAELRRHDHERYLQLSRVAVARTVQATFSRWRAAASPCRGALVWFLRDLMPGAGWGFLDDQGQPKSAWYALSRVLQPVALLVTDEGLNGLSLHLVNDTPQALEATLSVTLHQGTQTVHRMSTPCTLQPRRTQALPLSDLMPIFCDMALAYHFGPPPVELLHAELSDAQGRVLATAHHLCTAWPALVDDASTLQAVMRPLADGAWTLVLHAQRLALSVQVDVPGWLADDGYLDLAPGEQRTLRLQPVVSPARAPRGTVQAANHRWPVAVRVEAAP
jgi:beta-mannosidase